MGKSRQISVMEKHCQASSEYIVIDRYLDRLESLVHLMVPFRSLLNAKMANFFTKNLWNFVLPDHLVASGEVDLDRIYQGLLAYCRLLYGIDEDPSFTGKPSNEFEAVAERIFRETSVLKTFSSMESTQLDADILHQPSISKQGKKLNALFMMSEKKFVEVEQMSAFIARRAQMANLQHIVDFGSGKGYLSAMLNMRYGLSVLGLELSAENVESAKIRTKRMVKQWSSLCKTVENCKIVENCNISGNCKTVENCNIDGNCKIVGNCGGNENVAKKSEPKNRLLFSSCTVSKDMDLDRIISGNSEEKDSFRSGHLLCGLHTCGSLGNDLVDIFRKSETAEALIFVGCCYHLMDERFEEVSAEPDGSISLFPMFTFLIERRFSLGRSARMLASQSPERILRNGIEESVRSIFFRALFQTLLMRHGIQLDGLERVGKISVTGIDFSQYVSDAKQTVTVPSEITDEDARLIFVEFEHLEAQIAIVTLLRILMGPCIEQIILLDRAVFLSQQDNVSHVEVVPLFDPLVSPRTWAICAQKSCQQSR